MENNYDDMLTDARATEDLLNEYHSEWWDGSIQVEYVARDDEYVFRLEPEGKVFYYISDLTAWLGKKHKTEI